MPNKHFDVFGLFSKLKAYNAGVVASGVFLNVGKSVV